MANSLEALNLPSVSGEARSQEEFSRISVEDGGG